MPNTPSLFSLAPGAASQQKPGPMPPPQPHFKELWRNKLKQKRAARLPHIHAERCHRLQQRLLESEAWQQSSQIVLYVSMTKEVDTHLLLDEAWQQGKRVYLPRCLPGKRGHMDMLLCSGREELVMSRLGIPEPPPESPAFSCPSSPGSPSSPDKPGSPALEPCPKAAQTPGPVPSLHAAKTSDDNPSLADTLLIVPGLAFDYQGFRIGYGGGYYDRLLAHCPVHSVGLVLHENIVEQVPRDTWDMPVMGLCSEEALLWL